MITREYTVMAPEGLHARPAKELTRLAKKYTSTVAMTKDGEKFDPRSIIGVVTAQAGYLSTVVFEIDGDDETDFAAALDEFFATTVVTL